MAHQVVVAGQARLFCRVQHAAKIIGLGEREFGVAEGRHGRQGRGFFLGERAHRLVARQQRAQMIEMNRHIFGVRGVLHQVDPADNVALNGLGQIVHGIAAVGKAEVDDRDGLRLRARIAPQQVGAVQVVVRP